jgi:hypothetical protein
MKKIIIALLFSLFVTSCATYKKTTNYSSSASIDAEFGGLDTKKKESSGIKNENKTFTGDLEFRNNIAFLPNENKPFTGKWIVYSQNGEKKLEMNFINGKKNGLQKTWYENGQKANEINYVDGKENEFQASWHENGEKKSESSQLSGTPLSLDLNSTFLSPNYRGDNLEKVIKKFEKISIKDKYESTSDYVYRLQKKVNDTIYAFVKNDNIFPNYNADTKILSISIFPSAANIYLEQSSEVHERKYLSISSTIKNSSESIGMNAYGAMVDVSNIDTQQTALAVSNSIYVINIEVSIEPKEARKLGSKNVGLLFVCKLHNPSGLEPIAFQDYESSKATINSPTSVLRDIHFLNVDLYQVWLFDKISGKVLAKKDILM